MGMMLGDSLGSMQNTTSLPALATSALMSLSCFSLEPSQVWITCTPPTESAKACPPLAHTAW